MVKRILIVGCIFVLLGAYLHASPSSQQYVPLEKPLSSFPLKFDGWQGRSYPLENWVVEMLGVTEYIQREYRKGDESVLVYLGYYGSQLGDAEIHSPTHCLPGSGWANLSEDVRTVELENGEKIRLIESVYEKDGNKELFVYWYQMGDSFLTNKYSLKLNTVLESLLHDKTNASFIRLSSRINEDKEKAFSDMTGFMNDFIPEVMAYLPN